MLMLVPLLMQVYAWVVFQFSCNDGKILQTYLDPSKASDQKQSVELNNECSAQLIRIELLKRHNFCMGKIVTWNVILVRLSMTN